MGRDGHTLWHMTPKEIYRDFESPKAGTEDLFVQNLKMISLENEEIPKEMECVVLEKPYTLKNKTIPVWDLTKFDNNEDMLLLKVKACGVCGSDYRYYEGENPWSQHTLGYHVENKPNIVLGHEFAGEVVAVMSEKNKKWLGKRVAPICSIICKKCYFCTTNRENICPNTVHLGHGQGWGKIFPEYFPGAYAQYVVAWSEGTFEIPETVSYEEAAMMDILAVCNHVFKQGEYRKGGLPILLIGAGSAGNGIGQVSRIQGCEEIFIIEKSELAMKIARETFSSTMKLHIYDANKLSNEEIQKDILQKTNGHGCISVFDSVGNEGTLNLGLTVLDKGGTFVNMAVHNVEVKLNCMKLSGERKITTSSNFDLVDYEEALRWLGQGKFNVKPWITNVGLKEIPEIFKTIVEKKEASYFKVEINKFE